MSITAECNSCGRRYQAPASMAGKRVRCKQCGNIFELPDLDGTPDLDALAEMERSFHSLDGTMGSSASGTGSGDGGAGEPSEPEYAEDPGPLSRGRMNVRFNHPYAKEVDQFLAPILAIGGIVWLAVETFRRDETGQPWVSVVRIAVALLAYVLFIAPMTLVMIRAAGRKLGYQMPRTERWRTFAAYLPAFVLGLIMWVAGDGSLVGLILGALIGILLSTAALWLLFRLKPQEIAPSAAYALIGFFIGLTLACGIFFGLNALLLNLLVATKHFDAIPASPVAQGMPWISRQQKAADLAQETPKPAPQPAPSVSEPQQPAPTPSVQQSQPTQPQESTPPPTENEQPTNTSTEQPQPDETEQPPAAHPELPVIDSPVVKSIDLAPIKAQFDQVIRPMTSSSYIATLQHSGNDGSNVTIELWDTTTWQKKGSAQFISVQEMGNQFVLSPDGQHLARIATFPRLSAQIWSFKENRVSQIVNLDAKQGTPQLVGFAGDKRLLISWDQQALEVADITGVTHSKLISTPAFERQGNTLAINNDGTLVAIATKVENVPTILVYNIDTGAIVSRSKISSLDPRWPVTPTGMAFSPDSSKIAVLFEQSGNALLLCYKAGSAGPALAEHVYPAGPLPGHDIRKYTGSALAWMPDGKGWLIYGQGVFDMTTGQMVADLAMPCVESTRVVPPDIIEVVGEPTSNSSQKQIVLLRLDMDKLASLMQQQDTARP